MSGAKIVISVLVFVFSVFAFPTLYSSAQAVNASLPLAPVIQAFPLIFIMLVAVFPIYFLIEERSNK